jgi:hypothetical protein
MRRSSKRFVGANAEKGVKGSSNRVFGAVMISKLLDFPPFLFMLRARWNGALRHRGLVHEGKPVLSLYSHLTFDIINY